MKDAAIKNDIKREDFDFILTCCLYSFQYCTLLSFSTHQHRKNTYELRIKELEYVYMENTLLLFSYLESYINNDVPVMPVLVHFHIKYEIQHSVGIILLDTDHTCMQYSSHWRTEIRTCLFAASIKTKRHSVTATHIITDQENSSYTK
ncbi:hypothetical protein T12_3908 [Trichinella patagoniensis]|uniref:Uncharacterized protein n=1 Tax=Trichinella patagoniensis TaxID=990121 RepID=A0A0V1A9T6_9BILA|nr:hypothetical protein T12_3908 [Trichinella patagoniensis]